MKTSFIYQTKHASQTNQTNCTGLTLINLISEPRYEVRYAIELSLKYSRRNVVNMIAGSRCYTPAHCSEVWAPISKHSLLWASNDCLEHMVCLDLCGPSTSGFAGAYCWVNDQMDIYSSVFILPRYRIFRSRSSKNM